MMIDDGRKGMDATRLDSRLSRTAMPDTSLGVPDSRRPDPSLHIVHTRCSLVSLSLSFLLLLSPQS